MSKPFIKWAGGKSQVLTHLYKHLPKKTFKSYYEPFVGAGALFFSLRPQKAVLNDINGDLINTYRVVQNNVKGLIETLQAYENEKDFYYRIREISPMELTPMEAAARFIYLNRTCFNGLYRVNSKNKFNVPFGNYKNPSICDVQNMTLAAKALKDVELLSTDFIKALEDVSEGDFVYFDPPYVKLTETSFVGYSKKGFGIDDQERLLDIFKALSEKGVLCMLSNADVPWTREAYSDFETVSIKARRNINSNGKGRGHVGELIIKNY